MTNGFSHNNKIDRFHHFLDFLALLEFQEKTKKKMAREENNGYLKSGIGIAI